MINVAVIGAGAISSSHIEGYLAFPGRCRIVAVADIKPGKAERQIARYGLDAAACRDVYDVLAGPGADLASVCTPPDSHAEIAVALLQAGVHTLDEKPMAVSLRDCDAISAAARSSGAQLSVVAQNRFTTPMMRLKRLLETGLAGRILHVQADSHWWRGPGYYDLWWRGRWASEGGGCTLNHGVHHIDALQWMMGLPAEVQAMVANLAHEGSEVEDISVAIMRFGSGALGQVTSSVIHHGQQQQLVLQTDRARIAVPWSVSASAPRENGFPERDEEAERALTARYEAFPVLAHEGHAGQIDDVLSAVERGDGRVLVDGREGRKTLELITAIYEAAITGARVALPLAAGDPFGTAEGLLAAAPRFHDKKVSVDDFPASQITTTGGYL